MEGTIKPPAPLSNDGNMADNWMRWKQDFMIFIELSNYTNKPQDIKAYLLRNYIGEVGLNAIQKLVFENASDRNNIFILLAKLDTYFNSMNEVTARYHFFTTCKQRNESIEDYVNSLKKKAETCNFGILTNSLIRDKIIVNLGDKTLRKKLFEVQNLDLPKLVSMYNEHNATMTQKNQASSEDAKQKQLERKCWRCKQNHSTKRCPARNFKCGACSELHHFTHCCPKNNPSRKQMKEPNKHNDGNTVDITAQRNTGATPPPFFNFPNRLYPELSNADTFEANMRYRAHEDVRRNTASAENTQTAGTNNAQSSKTEEKVCILS